jgi:hypothetical protein
MITSKKNHCYSDLHKKYLRHALLRLAEQNLKHSLVHQEIQRDWTIFRKKDKPESQLKERNIEIGICT